jgi:hypothetical protein
MASQQIHVRAPSTAPPDAVFAIVAKGARWPACTPIGSFELESPGAGAAEGPGAIRVFRTGPVKSREQIVESNAPRRLAYVLVSGMPLRDYRADIELEPVGDGTLLHWRASFAAKVPGTGWFCRWFMRRFLQRAATGIAEAAATGP